MLVHSKITPLRTITRCLLSGLILTILLAGFARADITVVINEVMASNDSCIQDPQGQYDDWIEIHNYSTEVIDIGGMYLTDNLSEPDKWRIPDNNLVVTMIPAGGYLIIWADNDTEDQGLHANFKLDAEGEEIGIFDSDGSTLIDSTAFDEQKADISYGRYPDGGQDWYFFANASPGSENTAPYPDTVTDITFSSERGFYDAPFSVTISTETTGAIIRYTTNGSTPSASHGEVYTEPIQISTTTCLRAMAYKDNWMPTDAVTHTYIFIDDVINQSSNRQRPGPEWPNTGSTNGQTIDYQMDPDIVNNPEYAELMDDALLAIPSICFTTDLENLFDSETGIYVNCGYYGSRGWEKGKAWERPVSVELINPNGSDGFQINAGLRMRGITSCGGGNPKHAFRLFFENEYGGSLKYPLFGDEGADEFEKVDLRCSQNYSWNLDSAGYNQYFTFVREVFARDLQRETGQPYTRSRYYHLYINGVYWGLYQTQERAEASYGKTYLGGDNEDYDTVKPNRSWPRSMECTDGTIDAYERLWQACLDGFDTDLKYYKVQGLNPNGSVNPEYERLVDVDNLIDYMLTIFYTGDFDAPISGWYSNKMPNNFFAIYNRVNPDGFKFFRHDAEHTMNADSSSRDRTGPYNHSWLMNFIIDCTENGKVYPSYICIGFNPQTLHQYLAEHPEYRMRFADHVHRHFFNNGPMTVEGAQQLFASRAAQIDMAIIAESARWGDAKTNPPRTKSNWVNAIYWVTDNFMPDRTETVLNQFRNKNWYPNVNAPEFMVDDSYQHGGYIELTNTITITSTSGTIYYTTDGSDPRLPATIGEATDTTLVTEDADKKILVPDSNIGTTWRGGNEPFDDSQWTDGTPAIAGKTGGVGYDNATDYDPYITYNVRSQMYGNMSSCYVRIPFTLSAEELGTLNYMTLKARCDDGFVAFINGIEVTSINKPDSFQWNSGCSNRSDSTEFTELPVSNYLNTLKVGDNILAIHAMNQSTTSSDFLISVELTAGYDSSESGDISPAAIEYTGPFTLEHSANLKARVLQNNTWSALSEAVYVVGPVKENLRITEIMYHPENTAGQNEPNEEFIELKNIGSETINLNLVKFTNGIDFTFPSIELAPGEYTVVVQDANAFVARYAAGQDSEINIAGQYTGRLANNGERIKLEDAVGQTILDFKYEDNWYDDTDGRGLSLTIVDPANSDTNSWNNKEAWRAGNTVGGSPGAHDNI